MKSLINMFNKNPKRDNQNNDEDKDNMNKQLINMNQISQIKDNTKIFSGKMTCPRCQNMNMIGMGNNNSFGRVCNRFRCKKSNGITLWNFSFGLVNEEGSFRDENDAKEEDWNKNYKQWICFPAQFSGGGFANSHGCGFISDKFSDYIPKSYEE